MTALAGRLGATAHAVADRIQQNWRGALRLLPGGIGALVLLHVGWILARRLTFNVIHYDETFFLWGGKSITQGLVPYRDFQDFKPPMVFVTNALALALFGLRQQRFQIFFTILFLASAASLYVALLRRRVGVPLALAATLLVAAMVLEPQFHDANLDDAESIGFSFFLYGLAALLWGGRRAWLANAIGGGMFVLCVLSKEPFALPIVGVWLTMGFAMRDHGTDAPTWPAYARQTIAGAGIAAALVFGYLAIGGGLGGYLGIVRAYTAFGDVCVRIGVATPLVGAQAFDEAWDKLGRRLLNRDQLLVFLPLFAAFAVSLREGLGSRLALAATVIASLYAVTLGRCFFPHYFTMGIVGLGLWTVLGARSAAAMLANAEPSVRRWGAVTLLALVVTQLGPRYAAEAKAVHEPNDYVGWGSGIPREVVDLVVANSAPRDRIQTDGSPGLYVFANRRSVTKESAFLDEFLPLYKGNTDEERVSFLRDKLAANPPKIIFLDPSWAPRKERHRRALWLPFLSEHKYRDLGRGVYLRP